MLFVLWISLLHNCTSWLILTLVIYLSLQLVLLGDSGVGKSCIVIRFVRGRFDPTSQVMFYLNGGLTIVSILLYRCSYISSMLPLPHHPFCHVVVTTSSYPLHCRHLLVTQLPPPPCSPNTSHTFSSSSELPPLIPFHPLLPIPPPPPPSPAETIAINMGEYPSRQYLTTPPKDCVVLVLYLNLQRLAWSYPRKIFTW